jgi:hypothetical protein
MLQNNGIHLGYCTNIHRGENWDQTFAGLRDYTLRVKQRVSPDSPYGIGLRLSADAARELSDPDRMLAFQRWLEKNNSYVFTINGFPYGKFHGTRVKEQVYVPDWTQQSRLDYTNLLFDILAKLLPGTMPDLQGSVSTLPGSFKEFITPETEPRQSAAIIDNLHACSRHIEQLEKRTGRKFHLGLEPEPLGYFETSTETVRFFEQLLDKTHSTEAATILQNIGVNYDTCHLALEYENAADALSRLSDANIRISKLHLSSALKLKPTPEAIARLHDFQDEVYLHQVIIRDADPATDLRRYRDLPETFAMIKETPEATGEEWRVHFHVPIHAQPELHFGDTRDHIEDTLDVLKDNPLLCSHMEMETYTWEVLPKNLHSSDVVDQLEKEYHWCLAALRSRGF